MARGCTQAYKAWRWNPSALDLELMRGGAGRSPGFARRRAMRRASGFGDAFYTVGEYPGNGNLSPAHMNPCAK